VTTILNANCAITRISYKQTFWPTRHIKFITQSRLEPWAGDRRHGQEGALALLWKCCEVFLCISSYSKTLSRRIIYALFSQPVVGFWGLCPIPPSMLHPSTLLGDFCPQTSCLLTPGKNSADAHAGAAVTSTNRLHPGAQ